MARRNPLTGDPDFEPEAETSGQVEGASMNGGTAPEGSAERVRDDADPVGAVGVVDDGTRDPVMVNTYDADGEAVEVPAAEAPSKPAQTALPGMPEYIWPRVYGRAVTEMTLAISGKVVANPRDPYIERLALRLEPGAEVIGVFTGHVGPISTDGDGELVGVAKVKISRVDWGVRAVDVDTVEENGQFREDLDAAEQSIDLLTDRIGQAIGALEEALTVDGASELDAITLALDILRGGQVVEDLDAEDGGEPLSAFEESLAEALDDDGQAD